jgi:topoisomerase-4 subunit B
MGDKVEPRKEWIEENVDFTLEDNFKRWYIWQKQKKKKQL